MNEIIPVFVKQAIFWLSYLYFPVAYLLLRNALQGSQWRVLSALSLVPLSLLAYARFVEPRLLQIVSHEIDLCGDGLPGTVRVAVAADFHLGIFPNTMPMGRIVRTVNDTDADLLLIPGDFTSSLDPAKYNNYFAPLAALRMPAYAVMGNHDVGVGGEDYSTMLEASLTGLGVTVLDPGIEDVRVNGKYIRLVGTSDYWDILYQGAEFGEMPSRLDMATIYLQHNPDMIKDSRIGPFDLMVAGHTHGGQIFLPWITCALTFACDTLRSGYADTPAGKLFVTSGTGMTGLPMRFGVPPRIDVLDVTISRCRVHYQPDEYTAPKPVKRSGL